jgi:hypothetical protein
VAHEAPSGRSGVHRWALRHHNEPKPSDITRPGRVVTLRGDDRAGSDRCHQDAGRRVDHPHGPITQAGMPTGDRKTPAPGTSSCRTRRRSCERRERRQRVRRVRRRPQVPVHPIQLGPRNLRHFDLGPARLVGTSTAPWTRPATHLGSTDTDCCGTARSRPATRCPGTRNRPARSRRPRTQSATTGPAASTPAATPRTRASSTVIFRDQPLRSAIIVAGMVGVCDNTGGSAARPHPRPTRSPPAGTSAGRRPPAWPAPCSSR